MSAPTVAVWKDVQRRDGERCVSCGVGQPGLQFQHRQATGMGGSKRRPGPEEGLTACAVCNAGFEAQLQREALLFGWKVQRWVRHPEDVPVFYRLEGQWWQLTPRGTRVKRTPAEALAMMRDVYGDEYEEWRNAA